MDGKDLLLVIIELNFPTTGAWLGFLVNELVHGMKGVRGEIPEVVESLDRSPGRTEGYPCMGKGIGQNRPHRIEIYFPVQPTDELDNPPRLLVDPLDFIEIVGIDGAWSEDHSMIMWPLLQVGTPSIDRNSSEEPDLFCLNGWKTIAPPSTTLRRCRRVCALLRFF